MLTRRTALAATASLVAPAQAPRAQGTPILRIGVLNDQSGIYRDNGGPLSVICAKQAIKEFAGKLGVQAEILVADHQGKPDLGLSIARRWFDVENVDVVMDFQNSALALATAQLAREKDKVVMPVNAGTSDLTGKQCTSNTVHWGYDAYFTAKVAGESLVKAGGDTWFFITADYALGHSMQRDATHIVEGAGGRVLGSITTPFPNADYSSALLQAQSSGAKVVCLAIGGTDLVNCVKQAAEFGLTGRVKFATLLMQINDVSAMGLDIAKNLTVAESFYWDMNDHTRAFAARITPQSGGVMPNMCQANCYSAVQHYLKAAAALGVMQAKASGRATVARMKALPVEDDVLGRCSIREDGRVLYTGYLFQVKSPSESQQPWDGYRLIGTVPGPQAARPLADGGCSLV